MKMDKAAKVLIALFFAVLTINGVSCSGDYGLPAATMELEEASVYAPLMAVRDRHQPHEFKVVWQSYTWLIFMAGMWALYAFCRGIGMGRFFSCAGVLTMLFCPRFFAQGHYSREMVLLSLLLCMLWLGLCFIRQPDFLRALCFAFAGALAANVARSAVLIWLLMTAFAAVSLTAQKRWQRRWVVGMICAIAAFIALWRLIPPAGSVETAMEPVLFRGEVYDPAVQPLPWYAPLWMLVLTMPLFAVPLFGCGQAAACLRMWKQKREALGDPATLALAAATLCWLLPLLWGMFRPEIHHIWQVRGFLYAGFAVMMAGGVMGGYRFGRHFGGDCGMHMVFMAGLILFFGWTARDMNRNHPYEYAYFNRLGHNIAVRQMELDEENVSVFNALQKLARSEGDDVKTVGAVDVLSREGLEAAHEMLPPAERSRLELVGAQEADYLYVNTSGSHLARSRIPRGYQKLFDLKSYDLIISSVYEKK